MAQGLGRSLAAEHGLPIAFHSAGMLESAGQPPTKRAVEVLARRGIDIGEHRCTPLKEVAGREYDLVACMGPEHVPAVAALAPHLIDRTFLLKTLVELAEAAGPRPPDVPLAGYLARLKRPEQGATIGYSADAIPDPIGRSKRFYQHVADELEVLVYRLVNQLWPPR